MPKKPKKSKKLEVAERNLLVELSKKKVNPFNPSELGQLPDDILEMIQRNMGSAYRQRSIEKTPSPNKKNKTPSPNKKDGGKTKKKCGGTRWMVDKDVSKALSTGVGVAEDMGSLGMKVGKTAVKDVEGVGKRGLKLGKRGTKVGMKVGKTAVKDVEGVGMEGMKFGKKGMKFGKKMLTMKKKKKGKSTKGKSTKGSYRAYLSKRLKEVKKAHPSWPQSKVFKEAVKGWKTSK